MEKLVKHDHDTKVEVDSHLKGQQTNIFDLIHCLTYIMLISNISGQILQNFPMYWIKDNYPMNRTFIENFSFQHLLKMKQRRVKIKYVFFWSGFLDIPGNFFRLGLAILNQFLTKIIRNAVFEMLHHRWYKNQDGLETTN